MTFERAQAVADAVLFEGYVLYPYRPSSTKNRFRWTFGVLAPRAWSVAGGCEAWSLEAQLLVRSVTPTLDVRLRFLRIVTRTVMVGAKAVQEVEVDGRLLTAWEEGELHELDVSVTGATTHPFSLPAVVREEVVKDKTGLAVATVVRELLPLRGAVRASVEPLSVDPPLSRVTLRVENDSDQAAGTTRAEAMRASLASTHLLVASRDADLVSLHDPPDALRAHAKASRSVGTYPILVGADGECDLCLCSPILLDERPRIAPESPGHLFDSGEIDEILSLRTRLLLPEEKARARASDPRTAALVDRVEAMGEEALLKLHGVFRDGPASYAPGSRVVLRPSRGGRRTDAQDLLYEGRIATVEQILDDVDGRRYLCVTVDDDPAADLHRWYGRYQHYSFDEVEPAPALEGA